MKAPLGLIALALAAAPAAAEVFYSTPHPPMGMLQHVQVYHTGPVPVPAVLPGGAWRAPGYYPYAPVVPYYYPYQYGYLAPVGSISMACSDYAFFRPADRFVHDSFASAAAAAPAREPLVPLAPDAALITLEVPADAAVVFQGQATKLTGARRSFVTPALSGRGTYAVKVSWPAGDKTEEQVLTIDVNPGDRRVVTVLR